MNPYIGTKLVNMKPITRKEYNDFRGLLASQTDMLSEDWQVVE